MMNRSGQWQVFRSRPARLTLAALALLQFAFVAPAGADPARGNRFPDLGDCTDLAVPRGSELVLHGFGVGVQIYTWTGTSWSFVSPEALLFADSHDREIVAFHFAGPTWESLSGSTVVGSVLESCTPNLDAIAWLKLGAASNTGHGVFRHVSFIQRLNTVGGKAPAVPGSFPGQIARVPYTADYYFYVTPH
jgi:hypothetical protein